MKIARIDSPSMMSGPRVRPARQLSLQQPSSRRQHARRQSSMEDEVYARNRTKIDERHVRIAWAENRVERESIDSVEVVARQICGKSRKTRSASSSAKILKKPTTAKTVTSTNTCTSSLAADNNERATIFYSRQELAERLRLAWKHREQSKANIDIFLAHGNLEENYDSELSDRPTEIDKDTMILNSAKEEKNLQENCKPWKLQENKIDSFDLEKDVKNIELIVSREHNKFFDEIKDAEYQVEIETKIKDVQEIGDVQKELKSEVKKSENENVDVIHVEENEKNDEWKHEETKDLNLKNDSPECEDTERNISKESEYSAMTAKQKRFSFQSGTNRAFLGLIPDTQSESNENVISDSKSSDSSSDPDLNINSNLDPISQSNLNIDPNLTTNTKTIVKKLIPTIDITHSNERPLSTDGEIQSNLNPNLNSNNVTFNDTITSRRTNSAPLQRRRNADAGRLRVNIVIDAPRVSESVEKTIPNRTIKSEPSPVPVAPNRTIKSAPPKRRSKSAKRRTLVGNSLLRDEGEGCGMSRNRSSTREKSTDGKTYDVVTMVSLVSSADSESDDDRSPIDDKLIDQLRSKLPTTSIIKNSVMSRTIRKPVKSVSFHKDSFDEPYPCEVQPVQKEERKFSQMSRQTSFIEEPKESGSKYADISSAVKNETLALPLLSTLFRDDEKKIEAPLTDREKRCLAVPIGDTNDKKRRLIRTRSVPAKIEIMEDRSRIINTKDQCPRVTVPQISSDFPVQRFEGSNEESLPSVGSVFAKPETKGPDSEVTVIRNAPEFQTNKEKECWHLYKRMCDKGVYVSFDTVLRGMLTPTEYRLRQKESLVEIGSSVEKN